MLLSEPVKRKRRKFSLYYLRHLCPGNGLRTGLTALRRLTAPGLRKGLERLYGLKARKLQACTHLKTTRKVGKVAVERVAEGFEAGTSRA